jgi:hypothetical protein
MKSFELEILNRKLDIIKSIEYQVNDCQNPSSNLIEISGEKFKKGLNDYIINRVCDFTKSQDDMINIIKSTGMNPESINEETGVANYSYRQIYSEENENSSEMLRYNNDLLLIKSLTTQILKLNEILKSIDDQKNIKLPKFIIEELKLC